MVTVARTFAVGYPCGYVAVVTRITICYITVTLLRLIRTLHARWITVGLRLRTLPGLIAAHALYWICGFAARCTFLFTFALHVCIALHTRIWFWTLDCARCPTRSHAVAACSYSLPRLLGLIRTFTLVTRTLITLLVEPGLRAVALVTIYSYTHTRVTRGWFALIGLHVTHTCRARLVAHVCYVYAQLFTFTLRSVMPVYTFTFGLRLRTRLRVALR